MGLIIESYLNSMYSLFLDNDIKILFVLDGARNPLKAATNSAHKKISDDAKMEMTNLMNTHDPEQLRSTHMVIQNTEYKIENHSILYRYRLLWWRIRNTK